MFCIVYSCAILSVVRACGEGSCSFHLLSFPLFLFFLQSSLLATLNPPFRHREEEEEEEEKDEELQKAELSRQASGRYFSRRGLQGVES